MKTKKLTRAQKEALGLKKPLQSDYERRKAGKWTTVPAHSENSASFKE